MSLICTTVQGLICGLRKASAPTDKKGGDTHTGANIAEIFGNMQRVAEIFGNISNETESGSVLQQLEDKPIRKEVSR